MNKQFMILVLKALHILLQRDRSAVSDQLSQDIHKFIKEELND